MRAPPNETTGKRDQMAERRSARGGAGRAGAGRRSKPTKSGPNPAILVALIALAVVSVVIGLIVSGGDDDEQNGPENGESQTAQETAETTTEENDAPSIFDAGNASEAAGESARPRVTGREPKTVKMAKLTDHVGELYLTSETQSRIKALEDEVRRFATERWDISKELRAEYAALEEAVSKESNDPFMRAVNDELNNYNKYVFKRSELHLKGDDGKLLPGPFKGFAYKPYAIFVQASPKGGEEEMAKQVHTELVALSEAFRSDYADILAENEKVIQNVKGARYKTADERYPVMKVMLFQSRKDYNTYNRIKDPERDVNFALAHYEPDKRRLHVPMSGFDPHERREVMFHEGLHQLMHRYADKSHLGAWGAMWSDEGVAEYYGGHTVKDDGTYEFGTICSRISSVAADDKNRKRRLSLEDLLSWTRSDYAREKERTFERATATHLHVYSQGWALVKFLGQKYPKQFKEIMRRQIVAGDAGLPVFRMVFGDDFERIEEEFHVYQDQLTDEFRSKKLENGQLN